MKILVVTRSTPFHPGAGGMEQVSWLLATKLSESMAVTVVTTALPPEVLSDGDLPVVAVPGTRPGRYGWRWWRRTGANSDVKRCCDAVLSVSTAAAAMALRQPGPRYIFQAHGTALLELRAIVSGRPRLWPVKAARMAYWTVIDVLVYRRAAAVVAASEHVTEALQQWPYRLAWKVTDLITIPNAVDTDFLEFDPSHRRSERRRLSVPEGVSVLLTASRVTRQKGVDLAIASLEHMPDVHLVVAGEGDDLDNCRRLADAMAPGRVHFVGQADRSRMVALFAAADVFLLPARHGQREGLPTSVLEALAAGLPVVASQDINWPTDLGDVITSVQVESRSIATAAEEILKERQEQRRTLLPDAYTLEGWVKRYADVLRG